MFCFFKIFHLEHPANTDSGFEVNLHGVARVFVNVTSCSAVGLGDVVKVQGDTGVRSVTVTPVCCLFAVCCDNLTLVLCIGAVRLLSHIEGYSKLCTDIQLPVDKEVDTRKDCAVESVLVELVAVGITLFILEIVIS